MKVEALTEIGAVELKECDGGFAFEDIFFEIIDKSLYIRADKTPVSGIKVTKENTLFSEAKIMGDAWERGYGDFEWKAPDYDRMLPWYFTAAEGDKIFCFGVKTQPNAFCGWICDKEKISLCIDIKNGSNPIVLNGRRLEMCTVVEYETRGDIYKAQKEFCKMMCDKPILPDRVVYGGNDWYCNYGESSYEKIMSHTEKIVECSKGVGIKPYMVIDDGWQICHCQEPQFNGGPWRGCNYKFKDMERLARAIEKAGAIPGIWFRPLFTFEDVPESSVLKRDGFMVYLDPSDENVLSRVAEDVKSIVDRGYKLIKHDFTTYDIFGRWGFECGGFLEGEKIEFFDKTKTTAEIIKKLYETIRKSAGDKAMIIGCNTISHLSAGLFEIQRTGDDTSGREWERTKKYGINTLAFRMAQHNTFYCADADCVGITNEIDFEKNKMWLDVIAKSGTALFVSIAEDAYTEEVKEAVSKAFKTVCDVKNDSRPRDWMECRVPQKWISDLGEDKYLW